MSWVRRLRGVVVSAVTWATIVMLAERRRAFSALSARRFALWGFAAGILFVGGFSVAYALSGRYPFGLSDALWTAFYGVVGAGIGTATFRLARRDPLVGVEDRDAVTSA
jgi:hypothetical protein